MHRFEQVVMQGAQPAGRQAGKAGESAASWP
jgi:hypothetical protein